MDNWSEKYKTLQDFTKETRLLYKNDAVSFNLHLNTLIETSLQNAAFKEELNIFFYDLLENAYFIQAFTNYGINSNLGFFPEITGRIRHKILPPVSDKNELSNYIKLIFANEKNIDWLSEINLPNWKYLFSGIDKADIALHEKNFSWQMVRSIVVLTNRLVNIGLDPYLSKKLPPNESHHNAFLEFNLKVNAFVAKYQHEANLAIDRKEIEELLLSLDDCEKVFTYLRSNKDVFGISLHLTFILERASQHIIRLKLLLNVYINDTVSSQAQLITTLLKDLVFAEFERYSVLKFFKQNSNLLAYRIVSHTSEKGGHYIGFTKKENRTLFLSAMGGGLVVVFLVFIKNFIHQIPNLSLFAEGLLFGLNYSLGFILMHLWHFTLATKQPAMTASFIAESMEHKTDDKKALSEVLAQIIRSQFVSLLGNLLVVLPICFLIAWGIDRFFFIKVFNYSIAEAQLTANHPFYSPALIYAALTGVFLSLSGLITGYYDNKIVFSEIPERIRNHSRLKRMMKPERLNKFSLFIGKNAGAIIGCFFLGMILGGIGSFGKFIGLPIDIRHVTISSGNFGIALGSIEHYNLAFILTVFCGILAIGVVNIAVSFLISFYVACRSRSVTHRKTLGILKELFVDVFKKPTILLKPKNKMID
jgi:site-specific recombinase